MSNPDVDPLGTEQSEAPASAAATEKARSRGFFVRRRSLRSPNEALQPEAAPPPPPPRKKKRREGTLSALSGFLSFALLAIIGLGFGFVVFNRSVEAPGPLTSDKVVNIAQGVDVPEIIELLEREGVIDNSTMFNIDVLLRQKRDKLRAGEYLFKARASMRDVIDTIVSGKQILHAVTIPEGLTSEQIVQRLRDFDFLAGDVKEIPKEGTLLPDTYKVARGYARADLLRKMQEDQKKQIDLIWQRRSPDLPIRTSYELLTLASIVEKETGKADERSRVAGVFVNRLQKRMRLQSDPTIVYGLVGGRGTLGRGILRSEIEKWTPYNTYAIDGLPPGPIANPGKAALEAVANPSRTQDLYFVADGTGGHVFADSLETHNANVKRWRQLERERGIAADRVAPGADLPTAPSAPSTLPQAVPGSPMAPGVPGMAPGQGGGRRGDLQRESDGMLASLDPNVKPWEISLDLSMRPEVLKQFRPIMPSPEALQAAAIIEPPSEPPPPEPVKVADKPTFIANFDRLDVRIEGIDMDGGDEGGPGTDMTYPVNPKALAEQRARAARLGLNPITDGPAPAPEPASDRSAYAAMDNAQAPQRRRIFDASEGTPLDPLKNKNWDLNSPKTVPSALSLR